MRNITERDLVLNHPDAFTALLLKCHREPEKTNSRKDARFFQIGEGWLPIVTGLICVVENLNSELHLTNLDKSIGIYGLRVTDNNSMSVSFQFDDGIDEIWIEKAHLAHKMAAEISRNICEICGYHKLKETLEHSTKCFICNAKDSN